jgi:hypothetical protein
MIVIVDNFFESSIFNYTPKPVLTNDNIRDSYATMLPETEFKDIKEASEMQKAILDKASNYFDLSEMNYYETWTHENSRPNTWHHDKDELLYKEEEKLKFPLCSTVFYANVSEDIKGGKLLFENGVTVEPKFNRLVIFSPGLYHGVEVFRGKRTSININPWIEPIRGWTGDNESSIK